MKVFEVKSVMLCTVLILLLPLLGSCVSNEEREACDSMSYPDVFDSLVMENISLDSLSKSLKIEDSDLIKIRYGLKPENEELTVWLRDLKNAYAEGDKDECEDLLSYVKAFEIVEKELKHPVSLRDYKKQEYIRNEKFQAVLPQVGYAFLRNSISEFVGNQYSLFNLPSTLYDYITLSKEQMVENYKKELQKYIVKKELETRFLYQINAYKNLLLREHEVLFHKQQQVPDFSMLRLEKLNIDMTAELQEQIIQHVALDAKDFSIDVLENTIIALIIWIIISIIIEVAIERAISEEIRNCRLSWNSKQGFWKNVLKNAISIGISSFSLEEKKMKIKKKWREIQMICMIAISVALFIYSYFAVIQPSAELEVSIMEELHKQSDEYFKNLDLWVLSLFNNITNLL